MCEKITRSRKCVHQGGGWGWGDWTGSPGNVFVVVPSHQSSHTRLFSSFVLSKNGRIGTFM